MPGDSGQGSSPGPMEQRPFTPRSLGLLQAAYQDFSCLAPIARPEDGTVQGLSALLGRVCLEPCLLSVPASLRPDKSFIPASHPTAAQDQ